MAYKRIFFLDLSGIVQVGLKNIIDFFKFSQKTCAKPMRTNKLVTLVLELEELTSCRFKLKHFRPME